MFTGQLVVNGHRFWSCDMVESQEYSTYDAAKAACLNDWQCTYVLDQGCDDVGPFKLCTATSMIERSQQDCIYNKRSTIILSLF